MFLQLSKALDAQYDALYNTAKDVLQKKQERLEEEIALEAVDLATESIMIADQKREQELKDKAKRREKVKAKALELVEEYKDYYQNGNHFRWGIVIKDTNEIIGLVQLHTKDIFVNK